MDMELVRAGVVTMMATATIAGRANALVGMLGWIGAATVAMGIDWPAGAAAGAAVVALNIADGWPRRQPEAAASAAGGRRRPTAR